MLTTSTLANMYHHEHSEAIVCPHCGYEFEDSCESADPDREQEITCAECWHEFILTTHVSITYTTRLKKKE
jgi:DNA-directed RNA polymerase subunit RPC12/RpoP